MIYLLDANTYIQAKNQYYAMDFCPAYWSWLDVEFQKGTLASVSMVYDELKTYGDELSDWVKTRQVHFGDVSDAETQFKFVEIATFLMKQDFNPADRDQFLSGADPWLIAKASVIGATVVTQESLVPENSKKVKVPNVCRQFGVEFVTTFRLLSLLDARFELAHK